MTDTMYIFSFILFFLVIKCHGVENYFKVLGITRKATKHEIKSAYRSISKRIHPDKNQCDMFAAEKFINLTKAYKTLVDRRRRSIYETLNPDFGHQKEEYEWNIPVCTKGKLDMILESIRELLPDYVNESLHIFNDWLRLKLRNVIAILDSTDMKLIQSFLYKKLTMTFNSVHVWLTSLKSTVEKSMLDIKRGRYDVFPDWLRNVLIENEDILNLNQLIGLLLYMTSNFLSR
ncbi:uncharacterized protein LOC134727025 [Mytilus trossulus]|uniref:uncharacterized protein LOC134727025 n=1 Tax=Mytilus trossulus TaxID=6551 RepID=UPI003006A691